MSDFFHDEDEKATDRSSKRAARTKRAAANGYAAHAFAPVRWRQITPGKEPAYLIQGLIPREGLVVVWGPPKCGKTFWVFDLVAHVALNWAYRGRRVETGTVVYIACEGERGLAARKEAFQQTRLNEEADPPFYLLTTRLDLPSEVDALILDLAAQIPDAPCAAIVLDTLNRSIRGSESKDEDMGAYVVAADALRERFRCAVIIIHHSGIDASRPRGHTSLTGAVDAQLAVKRDGAGLIIATLEWMKDGPEGAEIVSSLKVIEIGRDTNDEPMTSCIIEPADPTEAKSSKPSGNGRLSPRDQIALDALKKAITQDGVSLPANNHVPDKVMGVTLDMWRRYFLLSTGSDDRNQNARWKAFQRSRDSLQARHIVAVWQDFVWTT
jgi:hypothetical protein